MREKGLDFLKIFRPMSETGTLAWYIYKYSRIYLHKLNEFAGINCRWGG
jgi:hypothetical protein